MITTLSRRIRYLIFVSILASMVLSCGLLMSTDEKGWLNIENTTPSLTTGQSHSFVLVRKDDNGAREVVTTQAAWSTSKNEIAEFTTEGVVFAKTTGTVAIGAEYEGLYTSLVINVTGTTYAHPVGDVYFVPDSININPDMDFVTEIRVNTGTSKLRSFSFSIPYDPAFVQYLNFEYLSPEFNISYYDTGSEIWFSSTVNTSSAGPDTNLGLVKVIWRSRNPGFTDYRSLHISNLLLMDENEATYPTQCGQYCNITINGYSTPESTPEPTPATQAIRVEAGPTGYPSFIPSGGEYDFGSMKADGDGGTYQGETIYFTIYNDGWNPIEINSISVYNTQDYDVYIPYTFVYTIAAYSNITITISFDPWDTGSRDTQLQIASNDPVMPYYMISLKGIGDTYLPTQKIQVMMGPIGLETPVPNGSPYDFGTVVADGPGGTTSATHVIRIENTSAMELNVYSLVFSDPSDYQLTGPSSFTMPPYSNVEVQILFDPIGTGTRNTMLTIQSDDGVYPSFAIYCNGYGL